MKRTLLALTFGSALALATLLSGDGVSAQSSADCTGSCGPCPGSCPMPCASAGACEVAVADASN